MRVSVFLLFFLYIIPAFGQKGFLLVEKKNQKKVEVLYDGQLLTAYCYFDSAEKPVLFPLKTLSGVTITRGYPVAPKAGERTDHPHHIGLWLNYESVNGLDFWNNSTAIREERKHLYGSIRHQKVLTSKSSKELAELETLSHWVDNQGNVLLEETTRFVFRKRTSNFIIDRTSVLKGEVAEVLFKDVKDGFLGLRVARELEMPSDQKNKFVDAKGNETAVPAMNNDNVTGMYVNKEGTKGDLVWSTRSSWTCLSGKKDGETISIVIIDHSKNIGYPTYWHARGYGLFAANPLGQKAFSKGKDELNFKLSKGQSAQFTYRIVVHSGSELTAKEINALEADFIK
jgi:hypothetical protein